MSALLIVLGVAAVVCYVRSTRRPSAPEIELVARTYDIDNSWVRTMHENARRAHDAYYAARDKMASERFARDQEKARAQTERACA